MLEDCMIDPATRGAVASDLATRDQWERLKGKNFFLIAHLLLDLELYSQHSNRHTLHDYNTEILASHFQVATDDEGHKTSHGQELESIFQLTDCTGASSTRNSSLLEKSTPGPHCHHPPCCIRHTSFTAHIFPSQGNRAGGQCHPAHWCYWRKNWPAHLTWLACAYSTICKCLH